MTLARVQVALVLLTFVAPAIYAAQSLEVTFFDVGQGDAALVRCPDGKHKLLIDSGDTRYPGSSAQFRAAMAEAFKNQTKALTVAVASHPHADHIGSMQWVLQNFTVRTYIDNGKKADTATFGRLDGVRRKQVQAGTLTYVNGKQNSFSKIGFCPSVTMEIFTPWAADPELSDTNDRSVGVRLQYSNTVFLFVGDMEAHAEKVMLNKFSAEERKKLKATVLKVGHHGSDTSSTAEFITAVGPDIVVVSCGKKDVGTNARYKHPRLSTVRRFDDWARLHAPPIRAEEQQLWTYNGETRKWRIGSRPDSMWLTVTDGTLTVRTDGQTLQVHPQN